MTSCWPPQYFVKVTSGQFHAERMLEYGSSLLDVAVYEETQKGAMFFLIFYGNQQNPQRTERHSTCKNWMMMSSTIRNKITPCWHNQGEINTDESSGYSLCIRCTVMIRPVPHCPLTLNNQDLNGGIEADIWDVHRQLVVMLPEKMPEHMVSRAQWSSAQCRASRPPLCITYCSSERTASERQQILSND